MAAFRDAVGNEMFQGGYHPFVVAIVFRAFAADYSRCHFRCQIYIFTIGLFYPGPPRLPGKVYDRPIGYMSSLGPEFFCSGLSDLFHEGCVP